jgi:DNA repair photolyase
VRQRHMIVREAPAKSILSKSKIYDWVVNPYTGCQHGCSCCYARFMKRFTGHQEPWGEFVDVKINAPQLLELEITKKKPGRVWVSGVCDPYQPLERKYQLTRRCLEILIRHRWPVAVQTRSPLVVSDIDLLKSAESLEVGMTVPTADEGIRKLFEPRAPTIPSRIEALDKLHRNGIRTFVMVAPMLPKAEGLAELLQGKVDRVMIDRMNYNNAVWVYRKYKLEGALHPEYFADKGRELCAEFEKQGTECSMLF